MPDDHDDGSPLDEPPVAALDDLLQTVPRLVQRSLRQAELVRSAAGLLACTGLRRSHSAAGEAPGRVGPEELGVLDLFADEPRTSTVDELATASSGTTPPGPGAGHTSSSPARKSVPTEAELAVPDYDSLAASQVVPRLAMLSADDLLAVLDYEQVHRQRQTILNRVAQLLEG